MLTDKTAARVKETQARLAKETQEMAAGTEEGSVEEYVRAESEHAAAVMQAERELGQVS